MIFDWWSITFFSLKNIFWPSIMKMYYYFNKVCYFVQTEKVVLLAASPLTSHLVLKATQLSFCPHRSIRTWLLLPELRTYLLLLSACHLTSGRAFFLCLSCHSLPVLLPLLSLTRPGSSEVITWPFLLPTLHSLLPLTSAITWCRLHYSQWGMSTPTSPLSSKSKCPSSSWSSVVVGQV